MSKRKWLSIFVVFVVLILIVLFFVNLKWNCFYYFNVGLYSGECWKYWKCLHFDNVEELKDVHGRLVGKDWIYNFWMKNWEDVQGFDSLYTYYNSVSRSREKNAYNYSTILNKYRVVAIGGEIYTYDLDVWEYGKRKLNNK